MNLTMKLDHMYATYLETFILHGKLFMYSLTLKFTTLDQNMRDSWFDLHLANYTFVSMLASQKLKLSLEHLCNKH